MRSNDRKILIGKLGKPHGVKGYLYFHYYGLDLETLLSYQSLLLADQTHMKLEKYFQKSSRLIVKFESYNDRNSIEFLRDKEIFLLEEDLPDLEQGDFYLYQLEGLLVKNLEDKILGKITGTIGLKSNEVLVVKGCPESIDGRERLIPYIKPEFIKEISLANNHVIVDWSEDF